MLKWRHSLFAMVLLAALVGGACVAPAPQAAEPGEPAQEGAAVSAPETAERQTITVALAGAPDTLDPADHRSR